MKRVALGIVLLAAALTAQVANDLAALQRFASSLVALNDAGTSHKERIADDIMSLSEDGHRPSATAVEELGGRLTRALTGRQLSDRQASRLAADILEILRCAGMLPSRFRETMSLTENDLVSLGVSAQAAREVADRLATVGNEIRGPEDVPLLVDRLQK